MVFPHIPPPVFRLRVEPDGPADTGYEDAPAVTGQRRGRPQPYADTTVQRVRHLIETTPLSQMEIARRTGVPQATISLWLRSHGWMRPLGAPLNPSIKALWRIGPALKLTLLTRRLVGIAERMTRELEENPGTDIERLVQALQAVRMARVTLQGNRRRRLLVGRARTGFEVMKEDVAIRAALKEMRRGGVDLDKAPQEALDLVIAANTPAQPDHAALRPARRRGHRTRKLPRPDLDW